MEYRVVNALSKRGKKHIANRKPRQDRYIVHEDNTGITMAVADGHGGDPYVRSGFGARIACNVALKHLSECWEVSDEILAEGIKRDFDSLVAKHLRMKPLTDDEKNLMGNEPPAYAYGTTLLAARVDSTGLILLQIGDGAIHAVKTDGRFYPPIPEDENCIGNLSSSLVESDATDKIRIQRFSEQPACLILHTDGYEAADGKHPWDILEAVSSTYSKTDLAEALERGDKRKDDQTIIVYFDETRYDKESFVEGIAAEKGIVAKQQRADKIRAELEELKAFLIMVYNKYKRLPDDERQAFLEKNFYPNEKRYRELEAMLDAI